MDIVLVEKSCEHIHVDPIDNVRVGDFYWVKDISNGWNDFGPDGELVPKGIEYEALMCVGEIGSNFVGFEMFWKDSSFNKQVHFDQFEEMCRPESNWKEILQKRMDKAQKRIQEKTQILLKAGQEMCLIPLDAKPKEDDNEPKSFLPMRVTSDPKQHKNDLLTLRDETIPTIQKEIEVESIKFASAAKNMSLPDLCRMQVVKKALGRVEDHIFTIELYCGLQEYVHQIAKGNPADSSESIHVFQQMLFMDEETLFNYKTGGMDFEDLPAFDKWVVKPENLNRLIPAQRGIVAMRVRRTDKDYGTPRNISEAFAHIRWKEANAQTYLLLRNGENVYRIVSEIDFSPRLIPMRKEIGDEQFKKVHRSYNWDTKEYDEEEEVVTPDSVEFDKHVEDMDRLLKQYNRIVILIQGLLDRSMVFAPHFPINLCKQADMEKWIVLVRDEEDGLPCNKVTFEEYLKQLNSTLEKGKWIYIDPNWDERYEGGENPNYPGRVHETPPKYGWNANRLPRLSRIESIKRDGSMVKVSWPKGENNNGKRVWVDSETRPGWGHYERSYESTRMCHEWIPIDRVINVSDYTQGDYSMFLCDRALKGQYLKWAKYLLSAEDFAQNKAQGVIPEDMPDAKAKRRY